MYLFRSTMYKILNLVCLLPEHWGVTMPMLKSIVDELDKLSLTCYSQIEHGLQTSNMGVRAEISKSPSEHMPRVVLTDPLKVKTKGHPKTGNRLKSSLEISVSSK